MPTIELLTAEISELQAIRAVGRVEAIARGIIAVTGLGRQATLGDGVRIHSQSRGALAGEIVGLAPDRVEVLPMGDAGGIALGDRVLLSGQGGIAPGEGWIGRIVDPMGQPLDGRPLPRGPVERPLLAPPPPAALRRLLGERLPTGLAVMNTLLPLVRGQRIGLFAGSGVGKSSLLGRLARDVRADVVVIGLVGERGREVRDFVERVLGPEGMARSVLVTATSDQSPLMRRRCAWAAMTVAEHFRDEGRQVLLLVDSITRFAEAHREVALAGGEPASLRGFPPSTAHQIMALAERAGPGLGEAGDITAIFSVLVAGSDMEEPVADILRGVLDGHVVLDREIAERGRFPAIDVLRSVSRALPDCASEEQNRAILQARRLLGAYERVEMMLRAGLYSPGSDPLIDAAVATWPALDAFFAESAPGIEPGFARLAQVLEPAPAAG
ncbi:FliI/YscN family ATPase [Frigidibacter sp. MR17.24]|uniref:FliI/YscN family ATPase n=1 Tax=Frigidibacter sp. MR17.24 TaxID=3127345 RepID=UPI003012E247